MFIETEYFKNLELLYFILTFVSAILNEYTVYYTEYLGSTYIARKMYKHSKSIRENTESGRLLYSKISWEADPITIHLKTRTDFWHMFCKNMIFWKETNK